MCKNEFLESNPFPQAYFVIAQCNSHGEGRKEVRVQCLRRFATLETVCCGNMGRAGTMATLAAKIDCQGAVSPA